MYYVYTFLATSVYVYNIAETQDVITRSMTAQGDSRK
jgi:hypothetical protein